MPFWTRITNVFRRDRLTGEIDEELQSHLDEAIELGRDPAEARRAFGSPLHTREQSSDVHLLGWLDSLRADAVFGWRQLLKRKVTSAAAILSLALGIGACTAAFRLVDALLLRPLPVAGADRLYAVERAGVSPDGKPGTVGSWTYPSVQLMRAMVKNQAELIAVADANETGITYKSDQEMETAHVQFVSGWMFPAFGLRPSLGRLFTEDDDRQPGAHPYAVLSHDYWIRRFAGDRSVTGRTFRMSGRVYEIVGVGPDTFTGTETGSVADVFLPVMMHPAAAKNDWTCCRTLALFKPGVATEPVRQQLHATWHAAEEERAKGFGGMSKADIERFLDQKVVLLPASAGSSQLQSDYRRSLGALGVLVLLVLLIACANVSNLMTAQAAARTREMALRVSIGAGRWRLMQLVLVESAMLSFLAAAAGGLFAWWAAPFVVSRINPPDSPAQLSLPADWRVLGFALLLTLAVTLLFGLVPVLRASGVKPASVLKGGDNPHSRRRWMHALIAVQVAFCFLVLFVAGLFAATFERLTHRPMGFSAERVLNLSAVSQDGRLPVFWDQLADRLRAVPGVERVSLSSFPLLGGNSWNGAVSIQGAPPGPVMAYFLNVSPGWLETMKIPLLEGRDLRPAETSPGAALVNETFARQFFGTVSPVGKVFAKGSAKYQITGVVRDAPYESLRDVPVPVAYVPFRELDSAGSLRAARRGTFAVRTASANPLAVADALRQEVRRAGSEFRVVDLHTQAELVSAQTVRERLLAMLATFFALVALLLAGVGLYGVLDYSVLQRRREIGIRMAIGAQAWDIAGRVTAQTFRMVLAGSVAGLALGMSSATYLETLLYHVQPKDTAMLSWPALAIVAAAGLSAIPAVVRAVRIDPAQTLRSE